MQLARVVGTVVATRKDAGLLGATLLILQPLTPERQPVGRPIVGVDSVGAGEGEEVFFVRGRDICARLDLRLASGAEPANTMGEHEHAGRRWLQFSWHPDEWRPTADASRGGNLVNYLIGAVARFEEAS